MVYRKEIRSEILREKEAALTAKQQILDQRISEIYLKIPEIQKIDITLRSTAALVMRVAMESENDPAQAIERIKHQNLELQAKKKQLLLQNGYPSDYLTIKYDCKLCNDSGYIGSELCSCIKKCYSEKLVQKLSTILPVNDHNFESFRWEYYSEVPVKPLGISPRRVMEENYKICFDYSKNFGTHTKNLLLYGSSGLGKTFLSTCIAKSVAEKGFSVAYDTAISIMENFEKQKFSHNNSADAKIEIQKYLESDLLIIDDLGTELTTSYTTSVLYSIINTRLMTSKCMIINTNLLPNQISDRYSPAIYSRIGGDFMSLRFIGDDIRQLKKKFSR